MNGQYKIRRARDSDARIALGLMSALGYTRLDPAAFESVFRSVISRSDSAVLLAEDEAGQIVGLAAVSWRLQIRLAGMLVSIDELVVDPAMRGAGAGQALLDEVKRLAAQVAGPVGSSWRLQLETNRSRESYRRHFYLKNGFQEADSALLRYSPG